MKNRIPIISLLITTFLLILLWQWEHNGSRSRPTSRVQQTTATAQPPVPEAVNPPAASPLLPQEPEAARPQDPESFSGTSKIVAFQRWTERWQEADPAIRKSLVDEGTRLSQERRSEFKALIARDPALALQQSVSRVIRQDLPPKILEWLEKPLSSTGEYTVMYGLRPPGMEQAKDPMVGRYFNTGGEIYTARVFGFMESVPSQRKALLRGVAVDEEFAVAEDAVRKLENGERIAPGTVVDSTCPVSGETSSTVSEGEVVTEATPTVEVGEQTFSLCEPAHVLVLQNQYRTRLMASGPGGAGFLQDGFPGTSSRAIGNLRCLYIRVSYPDQKTQPNSEATAYSDMANNARFFLENSYGKMTQTATVTPLLTLSQSLSWYRDLHVRNELQYGVGDQRVLFIIHDDARAKAREAGYNPDLFDCVLLRVNQGPLLEGYSWGGGPSVWLTWDGMDVINHEVGHSLNLGHANFWTSLDGTPYGRGQNHEYGNWFDVMGHGTGFSAHYNTVSKRYLGWLPDSYVHQPKTGGVFRIYAYDQPTLQEGKHYALSVAKDSVRNYNIEYHPAPGNYHADRAQVIYSGMPGTNAGHLLDTTQGSPNGRYDGGIAVGRTYSDPEADIHFTVLAKNLTTPPSLDISYQRGPFPGNVAPVASLTASGTNVAPGGSITFTANASDANSDTLAYHWEFDDGVTGTNSAAFTRSFSVVGQYLAMLTVSDMKGGAVRRSMVVNVGSHGLQTVTGTIMAGGQALQGVYVSQNGKGTFTNGDGSYSLAGVPTGSVQLSATLAGYAFTPSFSNPLNVVVGSNTANWTATAPSFVTLAKISDATEGAGNGIFRLTRTGGTAGSLTVLVSPPGGSAEEGTDFTFSPAYGLVDNFRSFTIPAGSASRDVTVIPVNDTAVEGPESVSLQIASAAGYLSGAANSVLMTVVDNDTALPQVSVSAPDPYALESPAGDGGSFRFTRTGSTSSSLNLSITWGGTATSGTDYASISSTVTIPAGQSSVTVPVTPLNDSFIEGPESVVATINTSAAYVRDIPAMAATVVITDDDTPVVTVVLGDGTATEGSSDSGIFLISRTGSTAGSLKVYYGLSGSALHGTDYQPLTGEVVIPAGSASAAVVIQPYDDDLAEPAETVTLGLANFNNAYSIGTANQQTVTLADNGDVPLIQVNATGTGSEGGANPTVVFRAIGGTENITVRYTTGGTATSGSDYGVLSGAIVVPASGQATLTIPLINDSAPEGTETVAVRISPSTNYLVYNDGTAETVVFDNDSGSERVMVSTYNETPNEAGGIGSRFFFSRVGTSGNLTVNYSISGSATNGTDYSTLSGSVVIPNGQYGVDVMMTPVDDSILEGNETVTVTVLPGTGYGPDRPSSATYVIPDSETHTRTVGFEALSMTTTEIPGPFGEYRDIVVLLSSASASTVTVGYTAAGGDATGDDVDWAFVDAANGNSVISSGALVYPPGTTSKSIRIRIKNDGLREGSETAIIRLTNAVNAGLAAGRGMLPILFTDEPVSQYVTEERWNGDAVYNNNTWNSVTPAFTGFLTGFTAVQNVADNYSRRLSAQIVAPVSGSYRFWIASDDNSRLYLSTTSSAANKVQIAANGWSPPRDWDYSPSQQSSVITLTAGQSYYMEVQHLEGGGEDHVSVAWEGPGFFRKPLSLVLSDTSPRFVRFVAASNIRVEGDGSDPLLQVSLDRPAGTTPVTVEYLASGNATAGSDYTLIPGTLTFAAGEQTKPIPLTILSDAVGEAPEWVTVSLANPSGALLSSPQNYVLTLLDATRPTLETQFATASSTQAAGSQIITMVATPPTGRTITNWSIPGGNLDGIFAINAAGQVTLANPSLLPQPGVFQLIVRAFDSTGAAGDGAVNVICNPPAQKVHEERWTDFGQAYWSGDWTGTPSHTGMIESFTAPRNIGNYYSRRLTGYLKPTVTGNYTFWIAGNNYCRLLVSSGVSANSLSTVADLRDPVGFQEWDVYPTQQSAPVALVAGKLYRMELQHSGPDVGDHVSLAWSGPGISRAPLPSAVLFPALPGMSFEIPPANIQAPFIESVPSSRNSVAQGGTYNFQVNSNAAWTWTPNAIWLKSFEPEFQSGSRTFTYSTEPNSTGASRSASFTLSSGGITSTHTVVQPAGNIVDDHGGSIETATLVDRNSITNGSIETVGDHDYYRVEIPQAGTLVSRSLGGTDVFANLLNSSGAVIDSDDDDDIEGNNFIMSNVLSPGTYYLQVKYWNDGSSGGYQISNQFTPSPYLTIQPATGNVGAEGTTQSFTVDSNVAWSWSDNSTWVNSSEVTNQSGGQDFLYNVIANTSASSRTGVITLTGVGGITATHTITQAAAPPGGFQNLLIQTIGSTQSIWYPYGSSYVSDATLATPLAFHDDAFDGAGGLQVESRTPFSPVTSTNTWANHPMAPRTGYFTASFTTVPNGSAVDTVLGFSSAPANSWDDLAAYVRFNDQGRIDARRGDNFRAETIMPYSSGVSYLVEMEVDVESKIYWATVTPEGQAPVLIANGYAFRTDQDNVSQLANFAYFTYRGGTQSLNSLTLPGGKLNLPGLTSPNSAGPLNTVATSFNTRVSKEVRLVPGLHAIDEIINITNQATTSRAIDIDLHDNYGSDSDTVVHLTSSGDTSVGPDDHWFVLNDKDSSAAPSQDPSVMVSWRFPPNLGSPQWAAVPGNGNDSLGFNFAATLQAGESAVITLRRQLFESASEAISQGVPLDQETPDIVVEQPSGTPTASGANRSIGSAIVGGTSSLSFSVSNSGEADLTDLGVTLSGTNAADFTVSTHPDATVSGPGGSTAFTIRFAPSSTGTKTATVTVASNDPDESPYLIHLTGQGVSPGQIVHQAAVTASNAGTDDEFGYSVAVSGDIAVVGARHEENEAGAVYVFARSGDAWVQQQMIKGLNTEAGDRFGWSVGISGDTIVVGAIEEDSNSTGVNGPDDNNSSIQSGAVYVFRQDGTYWYQEAYLKASNTSADDQFGSAVDLSGDRLIIGARFEDSNATGINGSQGTGASNSGAAYIFVRDDDDVWTQEAYVKASNTAADDDFGFTVSISGNTAVVGASGEDSNATGINGNQSNNSLADSGAAYVFVRNTTGTWSQQAYLKASNTDDGDRFGRTAAISGDTIAVGARFEDSNATGVNGSQSNESSGNSGAAYVFVRGAGTWSQQAYLKASNTGGSDEFGFAVDVYGDKVVVGARHEDSSATGVNGNQGSGATDAGAAYVFSRSGTTWSQQAYLKASNTASDDNFGWSTSITGGTVLVGAPMADKSNGAGAAYFFKIWPTNPLAAVVYTTSSYGPGSLSQVIEDALPGATITFDPDLSGQLIYQFFQTITLDKNLTIDASALPEGIRIYEDGEEATLRVTAGVSATITGVVISGGEPGIINEGSLSLSHCIVRGARYGGIYNLGSLTLADCQVTGNHGGGIDCREGSSLVADRTDFIDNDGSELAALKTAGDVIATLRNCKFHHNSTNGGSGGAIKHGGASMVILDSDLSGNSVLGGSSGGAIDSSGPLYMERCSITWNTCRGVGGGIANNSNGQVTLVSCTVAENLSGNAGGGIYNNDFGHVSVISCTVAGNRSEAFGGGISNDNFLSIENSVIAGNHSIEAGPDILGRVNVSAGTNLLGNIQGTSDYVGLVGNALLSPLGNHGGSMPTILPLPGSPAINGATAVSLSTDQRGYARSVGGAPDIGAVESGSAIPSYVVNTTSDQNDGTGVNGVSLRDAVAAAPAGAVITFAPALSGQSIVLTLGEIVISRNVAIDASALPSRIVISGNDTTRAFQVESGASADLTALHVVNGSSTQWGGAIENDGNLVATNCRFTGCNAENGGGAISNVGFLGLKRCTVSGNESNQYGGGLDNAGYMALVESTVSGNSATGHTGGGIATYGELYLLACTIAGNTSTSDEGGGLYVGYDGTATLRDTTISANSAVKGGGVFVDGGFLIGNTIIAGNQASSGNSPDLDSIHPFDQLGVNLLGDDEGVAFYSGIVGNAQLSALGDFGGLTQTMPPMPGSPVINVGTLAFSNTDQRGLPRLAGPASDIGAVEVVVVANNADLSGLALSSGTLSPSFAAGTISYTASVTNAVTSVTVTPTTAQANAVVRVNGVIVNSGSPSSSIPLSVGSNTLSTLVTAQDGTTTKTYTVTVTRAASNNADLSGLALSSGTLAPPFAPGTISYTASVANAVTSVTVTATPAQANAVIRLNGVIIPSGSPSAAIALNVGSNPLMIQVTAQDGTTAKTYTVTITRAASSNADLSGLALSNGTLLPGFSAGTISYAAAVSNGVTSVTVTPTAAQANAVVRVNGVIVPSGSASSAIVLNVGNNTLTTLVTAQDNFTTKTYTINLTRAPSSNADLSGLTLSSGTLTPVFSAGTISYTAVVANAVTSVTVTPTATQANAVIRVDGVIVTSGSSSGSIALDVGSNTLTILITAQDGTTTKTYSITVTRAASNTADLSGLALSNGALSPSFAAATTAYSSSVPNSVTSVTVTPTAAQATSVIRVNGLVVASGSASGPISLNVGSNTITTLVTAQDGITARTYSVTITRTGSSNANLAALSLSQGSLSPSFATETTAYSAIVGNGVTSVTVTPATQHTAATLTVNGQAVISGVASSPLDLNVGDNIITVAVTAEDGTSNQSYFVNVYRVGDATIVIENEDDAPYSTEDTVSHGTIPVGIKSPRVFTIRNTGSEDLTGIGISIGGAHASHFIVDTVDMQTTLAPGTHTKFTIHFAPGSPGSKIASIQIISSDQDKSPFGINLEGLGTDPNTSLASDGVANLIKYAFNMNQNAPDTHVLVPGTGLSGLPSVRRVANVLRIEYVRRTDANLSCQPKISTGNLNQFEVISGSPVTSSLPNGLQRVVWEVPAASSSMFATVEVTIVGP